MTGKNKIQNGSISQLDFFTDRLFHECPESIFFAIFQPAGIDIREENENIPPLEGLDSNLDVQHGELRGNIRDRLLSRRQVFLCCS